ncbi:hypothetical protein [Longitalea luteola]|uniref:hypothetical protein n=1 Tax=Longitalea luteola TaxID=2812563 RepID=UPI001A968C1C|nr:hypothetical protein [Longitalea luteola]
MEGDALHSAWQQMPGGQKPNAELRAMIKENKHPVLKRVRKQLIIETIAFTAFLFVYYDFFDGGRKPVYANVLLVTAMLLVILHNIFGYIMAKRSIYGENLKQSLQHQLAKMKTYALLSISGRILSAACLLLFFTSVITFNTPKSWFLAGVVAITAVQLVLLAGVWVKRIRQMKTTINLFE